MEYLKNFGIGVLDGIIAGLLGIGGGYLLYLPCCILPMLR